MKRLVALLLILSLLPGCGQRVIAPSGSSQGTYTAPPATAVPTATPTSIPATPEPTATPRPALATFAPRAADARFAEELLSAEGEPIASEIQYLLTADGLSKEAFFVRFSDMVSLAKTLQGSLLDLVDRGRTLTADRRDRTVDALTRLMSRETLDALQDAYDGCAGTGEALPLGDYSWAMNALVRDLRGMEARTMPFFSLDADAARDYRAALDRYMGEPIMPRRLFSALEELAQTEAYALNAALKAFPEAGRMKEPISFGSYSENMAFLLRFTEDLCPLPDGASLPAPRMVQGEGEMDLFELAFHQYPGLAFLKAYAAHAPAAQQARWTNAPDGYLVGLAVHLSYAIVPALEEEFGLEYAQYRWYETMLDVTLTGITALLIHYYGYSEGDLAAYLETWGAESFTEYLYDSAMVDPFDSLIAAYGYWQYLDICQAALDAGCPTEQRFLREYLAAGPAPFEALKEYMVGLYQNTVDKGGNGE